MRRLLAMVLATATALSLAAAAPAAVAEPVTQCSPDPAAPKQQLRAEWIASVANIDWPSRQGLTADEQKAELVRWYDEAVALGLNAVVVQVRPTADAFWPSPYEPWSHWLSGTQGQDPGYDPLAFAVAEAHKRNLEFHAWFNPYRVSMGTDVNALTPTHPARVHPSWVLPYGGKLYYNPGLPEVRKFTVDAIMDAVRRYDIDAVHFDDYFYPYPVAGQVFDDAAAYAQYGGGLSLADWRRKNVDLLISDLSTAIRAAKPVRDLAQRVDRPGRLPDAGRRPDLRRPLRGHREVGARGVDRLHRAAGVLEHRLRDRRLREAGAVVVEHRRRDRREPLHRPREPQGGQPGATRGVAGPERDEPAADVQPGLPRGDR
jgi:uncharacterized lipoprotein YddW (UPF0748 family)